jgi:ankyrin repeat protein
VSSSITRAFFEKLKKGDFEEIVQMVDSYGLDCSTLQNDAVNFNQTPLFEAAAIKDQDKALRLA